jgi:hypothetical protein
MSPHCLPQVHPVPYGRGLVIFLETLTASFEAPHKNFNFFCGSSWLGFDIIRVKERCSGTNVSSKGGVVPELVYVLGGKQGT